MSVPLSNSKLVELHRIMQNMLLEAQTGNWQKLARLDEERRILINFPTGSFPNDAFASGVPEENNAEASQLKAAPSIAGTNNQHSPLTEEIADLDKQIIDSVQKARQLLVEETRGVRAQVSAKKGYATASTMCASTHG